MDRKISLLSALVISMLLGWMTFSRPVDGVMNWDVTGYYFYLPAIFIYDDVQLNDITWVENLREKYDLSGTLYQFHPVENQTNFVDQYPAGMAFMYVPAFLAGHLLAEPLGFEKDGFSAPYQWAISIWSFIIAVIGIFSLRKLLLYFFSDGKTALVLFLILAGSNYLIQVSRGISTPHNYLFTLYALFLISVVQWHKYKTLKFALAMAITLGLACLARPTEILAAFIPIFWGCSNFQEIKLKMADLWNNRRQSLLVIFAVLFLLALPQMIYWKTTTGHWFFMSYTNPGEGLDFLSPHTVDFLFSYRKGWFIYTPLMFIALFGFIWIYKNKRELFWSFTVFFLLNLYILSSWSCWWYAQCFSQRAMVQTLPVMAVLFGFSLNWFDESKWRRVIAGTITGGLFALTVFFQWQYENYVLDQWRMTKDYFWAVFGKTSVSADDRKLLLIDRPFNGEMIFHDRENYYRKDFFSYTGISPDELDLTIVLDSAEVRVEKVSSTSPFTGPIKKHYSELTRKDHIWIEARADVWLPDSAISDDLLLVCTADHRGGLYGYRTVGVHPDSLRPNAWNTIHFDYLTPEVRTGRDFISFYMWYRGKDSAYVKDFSIQTFEQKERP